MDVANTLGTIYVPLLNVLIGYNMALVINLLHLSFYLYSKQQSENLEQSSLSRNHQIVTYK